jgi:hypothetical protein
MVILRSIRLVFQDLSFGSRRLRRGPAFAAAAILSLGAGVWLAIIVAAIVLPSIHPTAPYPNSRSLVRLGETGLLPPSESAALNTPVLSHSVIDALRTGPWLDAVAEYHADLLMELSDDSRTSRETVVVSHDLFNTLGVAPMLGRPFGRGGKLAVGRSAMQLAAMSVTSSSTKLSAIERATRIDPGNYRIQLHAAQAYVERNACAKARPFARAAHALYPSAVEPKHYLSCKE